MPTHRQTGPMAHDLLPSRHGFRRSDRPRSPRAARGRNDGASAHGMDGAPAVSGQAGAGCADRGRRPVGALHRLRTDARSRAQHPGYRPRAAGPGRDLGDVRAHADPAQPQGPDRARPWAAEPHLRGLVRRRTRRRQLRPPGHDPEWGVARLPAVVPPRAGAAGAQWRGGRGDRASRARRRRTLPVGDALHRRGAGGAQAGAGHRPGRHRRMVDARLRTRAAGRPPRPYLRDDRLRAPARPYGGRAGRRRFGDGQCRRSPRAWRCRSSPVLPPRRAFGGAALSLAHLRWIHETYRRDARRMALAGDGQHHARSGGLPGRHL